MQRKLTFKIATRDALSNSVPEKGIVFDVPTRNVFSRAAGAALENQKYLKSVLGSSCVTGVDNVVNRGMKPCFEMQEQTTTTPFDVRSNRKVEGNMNCKANCMFRMEHPLPFSFDSSSTNASRCEGSSNVRKVDAVAITRDGTKNGFEYIQGRGTNEICQEVDVDENSWVRGDAYEDMYNPKKHNSDCYIFRLVHAVMCRGCCTRLDGAAHDIEKKQKGVNYVVGVCMHVDFELCTHRCA